jgi:hypothetical protein
MKAAGRGVKPGENARLIKISSAPMLAALDRLGQ